MKINTESNPKDILLLHSRFVKQKKYWSQKLAGEFDVTALLFNFHSEEYQSPEPTIINEKPVGKEKTRILIPLALGEKMIQLSKGSDLSLYILLLTSLKVLLFRYTSNEDIIVISPVNRQTKTEETINDLVFIRDRIESHQTFKDMVLRVRQSVLEAYENQDYPCDKLLESLSTSTAEKIEDIETRISHITTIRCSLENLHATPQDNGEMTENDTELSFKFRREGDQIQGNAFYDRRACNKIEILQFTRHLIGLISQVMEDVNIKISEISFLTEQEKQRLMVDFNSKRADFPRERTVHHFITAAAEKAPHVTALVCKEEIITYGQLDKDTDLLSIYLRDKGVKADFPVGILLERSPWMVKSILAVWKAGGAYIPLDTEYPVQRILEIIKDSCTRILITKKKHVEPDLEASFAGIIVKFKEGVDAAFPVEKEVKLGTQAMHNLSYIIYTSGSTGKPKGVMVEHIGMMNHITAKINDLQITTESIIAQNASHTFDISVWQFFTALTRGGKTVIYPNDLVFDPAVLISRAIDHQISIIEVVPSYLAVMLEILAAKPRTFNALTFLLVTGEEVKANLVKQWFTMYPGIRMVNAYGPTEASDDITHMVMEKTPARQRIPIGKPIQNMNIYIVDHHVKPCPIGVKGEIWVSGIGIGRGYLNDANKTQKVFTHDPFLTGKKIRLYKTGDLGRWLADGTIEFFGRKDHQVKVRGFRIELGEIEAQLSEHPAVKENVVVIKETDDQLICAYIVPTVNENVDPSVIKDFLKERLPYYMIPDYFVFLESMPLTTNGKIDRKVLSNSDITFSIRKEYTAPLTQVEETLTQVWADLLGMKKEAIGTRYDFFELGGQSLKATIMAQRIYKIFNINIPVGEIFKKPTIEGIASLILVTDWLKTPDVMNTNHQESEELVI